MGPTTPWTCSCGEVNPVGRASCARCGLASDATVWMSGPVAPAAPGQPPARLLGLSPGLTGTGFPVGQARPVTLGRAPGNQIVLAGDPAVSGGHARVYWSPPYYAIQDLGSSNGTYVNGQRISGCVAIHSGDVVQLGDTRFQFLIDAPAPYAAGAPYGYGYAPTYGAGRKDRIAAGVLAILLGGLGIHLFYLNKVGWGVAFLLFSIFTCGYGGLITGLIALVQGILYLCSNEADFHQKYVVEQRFF